MSPDEARPAAGTPDDPPQPERWRGVLYPIGVRTEHGLIVHHREHDPVKAVGGAFPRPLYRLAFGRAHDEPAGMIERAWIAPHGGGGLALYGEGLALGTVAGWLRTYGALAARSDVNGHVALRQDTDGLNVIDVTYWRLSSVVVQPPGVPTSATRIWWLDPEHPHPDDEPPGDRR